MRCILGGWSEHLGVSCCRFWWTVDVGRGDSEMTAKKGGMVMTGVVVFVGSLFGVVGLVNVF